MKMELRFSESEFTSNSDGSLTVAGYVNKTGQPSNVMGTTKKFIEKIAKGAFRKALENRSGDIDFLAEHDAKKILSSTRNGSLELVEDDVGLFMTATIVPTSWGKDYYELISNGIFQNMSFGFRNVRDSWRSLQPGLYERVIEELELFEVSIIRNPAYSQSTIAARGIDLLEDVIIPEETEKENREMEKLYEAISNLELRVGELITEMKEVRSVKEIVTEKREDEQTFVVEEIPAVIVPEVIVEEEKPEEKEDVKTEEEVTKEVVEEEVKTETKEEEIPQEGQRSATELEKTFIEFREELKKLREEGISFEA